jgi:hypothetical protein
MPDIHYRVEAAWDRKFKGYIDADPANPEAILFALQERRMLPPGYYPHDLAAVVVDDQEIRIERLGCSGGVCLYLRYSSLGSEQVVDDDDEDDAPKPAQIEAEQQLRYLLNELKGLEERENKNDRRTILIRLQALMDHIRNGRPAPRALEIIKEAATLPVQA